MISFTEGNESSDDVISRRVSVVEWLVTKPVGQRVDAEGSLLNEKDSKNASVDEATGPVTPAKTSYQGREDQASKEDHLEVVLVLPDDDWVFVEIGDISSTNSLWVLLHEHPAEVRVEKTFADRVWIFLSVGISVMCSVVSCPPSD